MRIRSRYRSSGARWLGARGSALVLGSCLACGGSDAPRGASGSSGAGAAGQGSGGGSQLFVDGCDVGTFSCDGAVAVPCDGSGPRRDCGAEGFACRAPHGCVVCEPLTGTCEGGVARTCNAAGTAWLDHECDAEQGMTCEPDGCTGACSPAELGSSYVGCDYYPTVTTNPVFSGFHFAVAIANYGGEVAEVGVTRGGERVAQASVPPGELSLLRLPWVSELKGGDQDRCQVPPPVDATRIVEGGAYRLRSTRPVSVYQFNPLEYELDPAPASCPLPSECPGSRWPDARCLSFSNDASLLFPANVLTGSYAALSWPSTAAGAGFISVVGTRPDTRVRVHGRGAFRPGAGISEAGEGEAVLGAGDVLMLMAESPADQTFGSDISGTIVEASAPVQVIGGSSCGFVPEASTLACDHLEQAMLPAETLGMDYLVTYPAAPASESPHVVRVLPVADGTTLRLSPELPGVPAELVRSPADGPLELRVPSVDLRLRSDKPVLVAHYLQGQSSVDSGAGDPSMSVAVPTAQYRNDYIFAVSKTYDHNFVNVVAPRAATVLLDGAPLPESEFVDIGSTGYRVARHRLPEDREVFRVHGSEPVGLVVYGYGAFTSYMYPGGLDLKKIAPPILR